MAPSGLQDSFDRRETKSLLPYIRPVYGSSLRLLALMDICAPTPHHPYGLVKPMAVTGFEGAGLTNLNINKIVFAIV